LIVTTLIPQWQFVVSATDPNALALFDDIAVCSYDDGNYLLLAGPRSQDEALDLVTAMQAAGIDVSEFVRLEGLARRRRGR
jgi:hypothetical protein